jgi:hypothetical protein
VQQGSDLLLCCSSTSVLLFLESCCSPGEPIVFFRFGKEDAFPTRFVIAIKLLTEMRVVVWNLFTTQIATVCIAYWALHFVAAFYLEEFSLALRAAPNDSCSHGFGYSGVSTKLFFFLHIVSFRLGLLARLGLVRGFSASSTGKEGALGTLESCCSARKNDNIVALWIWTLTFGEQVLKQAKGLV